MSTPVLLAIVLNLQTALQGIAQAAGYFNTVKATSVVLDPVALLTVPATEVPFIVVGHHQVAVSRTWTSRPNAFQDVTRFTLQTRFDAPGTDVARKVTAYTQWIADIEVAVAADITRGGVALDTKVEQAQPYFGLPNENICYAEIPIEIRWQRLYGKP